MPTPQRRVVDGRAQINRAEIMRLVPVSTTQLDKWYRQRERNGHPHSVRDGRDVFFDEDTWMSWYRDHRDQASGGTIVRTGRTLITRSGIAGMTGLPASYQGNLYMERASNGHPEAVERVGRWLYFDRDEVLAWLAGLHAAKRSTLTEVDRSGDPHELVGIGEAARLLGLASSKTIESYLSRNRGYFPPPDQVRPRRWRRSALWTFADGRTRPGRAGRGGGWRPATADPAGELTPPPAGSAPDL